MRILVTGGAGYIGSHFVKMAAEQGKHEIITIDNLHNGHMEAVLHGEFIKGDINERKILDRVFATKRPDVIVHFASFIEVGESVKNPVRFYENNVSNTLNVIEFMERYNVNKIIFSSTASVYGQPKKMPISESDPLNPTNPYGKSKAFIESVLEDMKRYKGINSVCLRYFNAAGADESGLIGEAHNPETHLIPLVIKAALGKQDSIGIFGDDYPTKDGTAIRDYIHVNDLCRAHLMAADYLMQNGESTAINCGYGKGYTVKEVIDTVEKVSEKKVTSKIMPRREGDVVELVAECKKIKEVLAWEPQYNDLEYIVKTALNWEKVRKF